MGLAAAAKKESAHHDPATITRCPSDAAGPGPDDGQRRDQHRRESTDEQLACTWNELLRELCVARPLADPGRLSAHGAVRRPLRRLSIGQVRVYLAVMFGTVLPTGFVLAPFAFHRVLFARSSAAG